jgi:hypothetical protein
VIITIAKLKTPKNKLVIKIRNYNEIVDLFICNFDFQYKPKGTIMINIMLQLVGIVNIMKINQYWNY